MLNRSIRVLLIEDDPREARLVIERLESDGFACDAEIATSEPALERALRGARFDIAIADYQLPGYDGFTALSFIRAAAPTLPVIMLSGKAGEELVAESFKKGAEDFVLKDRLQRLAPAIQRAIDAAAQRAQRDELNARLAKFGSFVPGMIYQFRIRPDGPPTLPYCSEGIRHIFGVGLDQVRDDCSRLIEAIHPDDRREFDESVRESARDLAPWQLRYRIRRADGVERWVQGVATPERLNDGSTLWHGFITDITEQRRAELARAEMTTLIERQNENLKSMTERAHRVVDDVSHEFRTPLAVIKEFASIIRDGVAGPVSTQQAEYLKIMDGAVMDLNHMVEDLLDSSKLRAGRLRVQRRRHRIEDVLAAGRLPLERKASSRALVIDERVQTGLPAIFADEEKVRRVLCNLVSNAIKFSPEGGSIVITAARGRDDEPLGGEVIISVADQGPGLSRDDLDRLFGRFQQVSTARSVAAKGFGLGLSIAHELTWLNLGALGVESEKGRGSTFYFSVPLDEPASIIQHFFATLAAGDRPAHELAILRVELDAPAAADRDEPGAFLSSVTYPTDLVLESVTPGAWWIIGRTSEPDLWLTRLREARQTLAREAEARIAPMTFSIERRWPYPEDAAIARDEVLRMLAPEPSHA